MAEVTREDLALLLTEARRLTSHRQYVIIGSLSILGSVTRPPARMVASQDVDLYPLLDPGRASEIAAHLGQSTPFDRDHGFYADAVSPYLATLPDGWQSRLVSISWPEGIVALCLEPHDAAVSKYARGEDRDREWIRAGLDAGILDIGIIEARTRSVVVEVEERERMVRGLGEDRVYLGGK